MRTAKVFAQAIGVSVKKARRMVKYINMASRRDERIMRWLRQNRHHNRIASAIAETMEDMGKVL